MTNQEKTDYLQRYGYAMRKELRLREEIAVWHSRAESITPSISGMPHGNGDYIASFVKAAEKICKLEAQLCAQMMLMAQMREDIEQVIGTVEQDRLREILELHYIEALTWEQIADRLHYGCRHVYKLHVAAINQIVA